MQLTREPPDFFFLIHVNGCSMSDRVNNSSIKKLKDFSNLFDIYVCQGHRTDRGIIYVEQNSKEVTLIIKEVLCRILSYLIYSKPLSSFFILSGLCIYPSAKLLPMVVGDKFVPQVVHSIIPA